MLDLALPSDTGNTLSSAFTALDQYSVLTGDKEVCAGWFFFLSIGLEEWCCFVTSNTGFGSLIETEIVSRHAVMSVTAQL